MQTRQRTNYSYLLLGIALLFLLSWAMPSQLLSNPWGWVAYAVIGIAVHAFILKNGGFLPKNGKATIHSKIIFWSIVVVMLTILAFIIGIQFFI